MNESRYTETEAMPDSEKVKELWEATFGCPEKGEIGMKKKVDELYLILTGGTWAWRIILGAIGLVAMVVGALVGISRLK